MLARLNIVLAGIVLTAAGLFAQTAQMNITTDEGTDTYNVADVISMSFVDGAGVEQIFPLGDTGIDITMVWIPSGSFMMGAQDGEVGANPNERPRHEVSIEQGFWMGKYEVTQEQWEIVMGDWDFYNSHQSDRPAEMMSWNDINNTYLPAINASLVDNPWRLPSEAEWEYAARAGFDETRYWWGDDLSYEQLDNYAWYELNSGHQTHTVGSKDPNPWNLYDVLGNVWEWTADNNHISYTGAPTDGSAWIDSPTGNRITRGGGFGTDEPQWVRIAIRMGDVSPSQTIALGFRLVRSAN
jgi:formylglycine-generating enzyme required for sulfatase activity